MSSSPTRTAARRAVAVLGVVLAGLVAAPAASASSDQTFPVAGAEFQRAVQIAQQHWGTAPCQGKVTYTWSGLEPLTNARATWSNMTDAWTAPATNFECSVVFNTLTPYDFPMLCTVMADELGHLLGHQHEAQDGLLMSAIYAAPLPECGGAPAVTAASTSEEASGDPIAWSVSSESKPRPKKRRLKKQAHTSKRKHCVVRFKAGKRTRRCVTLRKHSARKARTASARTRTYKAH